MSELMNVADIFGENVFNDAVMQGNWIEYDRSCRIAEEIVDNIIKITLLVYDH